MRLKISKFMAKLLLLCCFILFTIPAFSENVPVKISENVVVIQGERFYLHVVEKGQTLYSIAKAYHTNVDVISKINKKEGNVIGVSDVLKIPYIVIPPVQPAEQPLPVVEPEPLQEEKAPEAFIQQDDKYYYHKAEPGETIYSISRRFGIRARFVLQENEKYDQEPLSVGDIVRIPLDRMEEIVGNKRKARERVEVIQQPAIAEWEEVQESHTETDEEGVVMADSSKKSVRVAVLLPFFAQDNFAYDKQIIDDDSLGYTEILVQKEGILPKSEQFIYFYEGVLLALDSLKQAGYTIDVHTFDTYRSNVNMYEITERINSLDPQLIIGPVYASELQILLEGMSNKNIPVIYPLSSRGGEEFYKYPNFLQVNISYPSLVEEMTEWILDYRQKSANMMVIDLHSACTEDSIFIPTFVKDQLSENLIAEPDVQFFHWDCVALQADTLRSYLSDSSENVIVLPTLKEQEVSKILSVLSAYTDKFRITVIGFPEWQNFLSVDHETYYKLNVKFLTYSYIPNDSPHAIRFARFYRKFFYHEPHSLVNKAFDITLYSIPWVAHYREQSLEALKYKEQEELFSIFRFERIGEGEGFENRGLYIVHYGSDYKIKMNKRVKVRREAVQEMID